MSEESRLAALITDNPRAAAAVLSDLLGKVVHPHPAQEVVLGSQARHRVLNAGRRWGKTKLAAKVAVEKTRKPGQMIWWVAPTYAVVKRGYREFLRQLPDGVLEKQAPRDNYFDTGRKVVLHFKNGTRMEFYSAERPDGMLGEGVDFAVLDEAAIMPGYIWQQIVRPTLMDRRGGSLHISTPRGRNWFYRAYKRGQDELSPEWASWTFPSWTNTYLDAKEIEEMAKDLPAVLYSQEVEAKFVASGSNVFVVPDEIIVPKVKPRGHVVFGVDLAKTTDFTVFYAVNAADRRPCYFDRFQDVTWPQQRRKLVRAVNKVQKQGAEGVTLCIDSTGAGDPFCDDMEELGYDVVPINFTTYKDKMVRLLAKDMEDGKAFLTEDFIHEFEDYLLGQTEKGRITYSAPEGSHDDVVCARMLAHWANVMEGVPDATIIDGVTITSTRDSTPELDEDEEFDDLENDNPYDYGEAGVVDGAQSVTHIEARSVADMMNDPSVWG